MTRRAVLRASDADREQIAERLRQAAAEGRLRPDELEERLGLALSARTYGELDGLVADLPAPAVVPRRSPDRPLRFSPPFAVAVAVAFALALMLIAAVGSAVGGHPHPGQARHAIPLTGPLIWLLFVVIAMRLFFSRRRRAR